MEGINQINNEERPLLERAAEKLEQLAGGLPPAERDEVTALAADLRRAGGEVLTVGEVKTQLKCGKTTAYDLFEKGELEGFRLGDGRGGIRVYAPSVAAFKARHSNKSVVVPQAEASRPAEVKDKPPTPAAAGRGGRPQTRVVDIRSFLGVRPPRSRSGGPEGRRAA